MFSEVSVKVATNQAEMRNKVDSNIKKIEELYSNAAEVRVKLDTNQAEIRNNINNKGEKTEGLFAALNEQIKSKSF